MVTKPLVNEAQQKEIDKMIQDIVDAKRGDDRHDKKRALVAYVDEIVGVNWERRRRLIDQVERQLAEAYV